MGQGGDTEGVPHVFHPCFIQKGYSNRRKTPGQENVKTRMQSDLLQTTRYLLETAHESQSCSSYLWPNSREFKKSLVVEVAQSCPALWGRMDCSPRDYSPPGPCVHEFSRQEYWSRLLFPPPGDLSDPVIEPRSPALLADSLPSATREASCQKTLDICKVYSFLLRKTQLLLHKDVMTVLCGALLSILATMDSWKAQVLVDKILWKHIILLM